MKKYVKGKYIEMTPEEIAELELIAEKSNRKEIIISAIREKYSVDDEFAILRQRDTKPDEFDEYFKFVEGVKEALKALKIE